MGKPCEWPKCKNLAVYGDKYAATQYGEMCPYHSLMIQMYDVKPPATAKAEEAKQATE